ncbi:DsbA family oxidoreductase [Plantibacter sp. Mn2098]|uniref:DsbA family oxidoreductase n=1 Tax=Plantibacter sp. Mn2098 TaxID=3395266 RepID=UPI003BDE9C9D
MKGHHAMRSATSNPVRVQIWSDPQCVWCFIAHPRFEKTVNAFGGEVELTYRSFELRPGIAVEIDKEQEVEHHAGAERARIATMNALREAECLLTMLRGVWFD